MRDPQTLEEWQLAVDAAEGVLALKLAVMLGLIEGGGTVDVERCADIIHRGSEIGVTAHANAIRDFVGEVAPSEERERVLRVVRLAMEMSGDPDLALLVPTLAAGGSVEDSPR